MVWGSPLLLEGLPSRPSWCMFLVLPHFLCPPFLFVPLEVKLSLTLFCSHTPGLPITQNHRGSPRSSDLTAVTVSAPERPYRDLLHGKATVPCPCVVQWLFGLPAAPCALTALLVGPWAPTRCLTLSCSPAPGTALLGLSRHCPQALLSLHPLLWLL